MNLDLPDIYVVPEFWGAALSGTGFHATSQAPLRHRFNLSSCNSSRVSGFVVNFAAGSGRFDLICRDLGVPKDSRFMSKLFLASDQVGMSQKFTSNYLRV
jgi:hypothetical protein